jgi:hypothetical protein
MTVSLEMLALSTGCSPPKQTAMVVPAPPSGKTLTTPPEITSETEEGFADLVFFLEDRKDLGGGEQLVTASGMYDGQKVGLGIGISRGWSAQSDGGPLPIEFAAGVSTCGGQATKATRSCKHWRTFTAPRRHRSGCGAR